MSDPYTANCLEALGMVIENEAAKLGSACESPIELGMLKGLIAVGLLNRQFRIAGQAERTGIETDYRADVLIQHCVDNFRLDFAVHLTGARSGKQHSAWIAIECDGHEFHERTKEQAARDKSRDRALTAKGFRILRFTGSEIYRHAFVCATDVHQAVQSIIREWEAE